MGIKRIFQSIFRIILLKPLKIFKRGLFWILRPIFKPSRRQKVRLGVAAIFILTFLAAFFDYPKYFDQVIDGLNGRLDQVKYLEKINLPYFYKKPFHLGLDLQGGTHLVYEADTSGIPEKERDEALNGVRDVIERRVNAFGVAEPIVQTNKSGANWRVIVELAGVKDVSSAIKMIGETPFLEFKEENHDPARSLTPQEKRQMDEYNNQALSKANEVLTKVLAPDSDFVALAREYSEDLATKSPGGDLGYIKASGQYSDLFSQAEKIGAVSQSQNLYQNDQGYNILKVGERRETSKEVNASHLLICYEGAQMCDQETSQEEALVKIQEIKAKATVENFAELVAEFSTEPGAAERKGDLGWFSEGMMVKEFEAAAFGLQVSTISEVVESPFGYHLIYKKEERPAPEYQVSRILIKTIGESDIVPPPEEWKNTGLDGKQLKKSEVQFDPNSNAAQVGLEFNDEGKKLFAEITEKNVGKLVAIFLDGYPISIPRVNEPIREGRAVITGNFNLNEAKLLAQRLNAGALPVAIKLINQQTVGASLGQESLTRSLRAAWWGFLAVAIFMILYYRLPGLLAVISLGTYGVLTLTIFKIDLNPSLALIIVLIVELLVLYQIFRSAMTDSEKFIFFVLALVIGVFFYLLITHPLTLTLAGIAGFILSVGMAVDANVLIFERLKEELSLGEPINSALDESFKRAWPSIRDGNISTLITCFALNTFGTSLIKGFALTLAVGIIVSMFSAIIVTKVFLRLIIGWTQRKSLFAAGFKRSK